MRHFSKIAFLATLMFGGAAIAAPASFSHSGVLRENGELVNGQRNLTATIYDHDSSQIVGQAADQTIEVVNGIYVITINNIDTELLSTSNSLELGIKLGDNEEMEPRLSITSVPYAISANMAQVAEVANGLDCKGCIDKDQLSFEIPDFSQLPSGEFTIADGSVTKAKLSDDVKSSLAKADNALPQNGTAASANKLSVSAGSSTTPVYFTNGVPKTVTTSSMTVGTANTAKDLVCTGCVGQTDLAKDSVSSTQIQYNSVVGGTSTSNSIIKGDTVTSWNIKDGTIALNDLNSSLQNAVNFAATPAKSSYIAGNYGAIAFGRFNYECTAQAAIPNTFSTTTYRCSKAKVTLKMPGASGIEVVSNYAVSDDGVIAFTVPASFGTPYVAVAGGSWPFYGVTTDVSGQIVHLNTWLAQGSAVLASHPGPLVTDKTNYLNLYNKAGVHIDVVVYGTPAYIQ